MIKEVVEEVTKIISPVYLVGGAVRDFYMGKEINDYDFCTPFTPDKVQSLISNNNPGRWVGVTGKKYGTVGTKIYLPKNDCFVKVEITTFREEKYNDSRKPEVTFVTNLPDDLSRRDFTCNAMALRIDKELRTIDLFNGRDDIDNKLIRTVGSPKQRFNEDPHRMLRAARFVSTLGFDIEEKTRKKMTSMAPEILRVSKERWMQELDKLLLGPNVLSALSVLSDTRLLNYMVPELAIQVGYDQMTPHHDFTLWEHTCKTVAACPPDLELRWAALLHDVGKPFVAIAKKNNPNHKNYMNHELVGAELVNKIGRYLKWKKDRLDNVITIVKEHLQEDSVLKPYDSGSQKRDN